MLDEFDLRGNPLVEQNNYRLRLFVQFGHRASEVRFSVVLYLRRDQISLLAYEPTHPYGFFQKSK